MAVFAGEMEDAARSKIKPTMRAADNGQQNAVSVDLAFRADDDHASIYQRHNGEKRVRRAVKYQAGVLYQTDTISGKF